MFFDLFLACQFLTLHYPEHERCPEKVALRLGRPVFDAILAINVKLTSELIRHIPPDVVHETVSWGFNFCDIMFAHLDSDVVFRPTCEEPLRDAIRL